LLPNSLRQQAYLQRLERAKQKTRMTAVSGAPGAPRYVPRGSNLEAFTSTAAEVLLSGAAGTGKSRAWLEKLHYCAQMHPGMRGLIVRKTKNSLAESGLYTFEEHVLGRGHMVLQTGGLRRNRQKYVYPNGSEIVVSGMDNPIAVRSAEYDIIFVQEAIELSEGEWEELTGRLRNGKMPYQQIGADTNPSFPQHWLKRRADHGLVEMIFCRHEDNPRLFDPETKEWTDEGNSYVARLDRLTGVRKLRLRYGQWVQAEGAVYDEFDESIHVIAPFDIPEQWRRFRVVDFGYTNPFTCQWWAADDDGRLYLYREIYRSGVLVEDHARTINNLSAGERIDMTIADHDAEDRATLERHGISTVAAHKDVTPGIQAVQARLRKAGDGKPRLFLMRDALVGRDIELYEAGKPASTLDEMPGYMWQKTTDGKPNKEQPLKIDDHGMDALRYMVAQMDLISSAWGFDLA